MAEWTPVCEAEDVMEGQLLLVTPIEEGVVLTRFNGELYAVSDTCTHEWCQLSEGRLDEDELVCNCHGSVFNLITGEVLLPPATDPLPTYQVRVVNGQVEVLV